MNDCYPASWNVSRKERNDKRWWDAHLIVLNIKYIGSYTLTKYIQNMLPKLNYDKLGLFFVRLSNILRGFYFLSTNNIIHSDIHSENIMLSGNIETNIYDIKIIDFGNSKPGLINFGLDDAITFFRQLVEEFDTPFGKRTKLNSKSIFENMKLFWIQCEEKADESRWGETDQIEKAVQDNIYIIVKYLDFIKDSFGDMAADQAYREYFSDIMRPL